jgi:hypothetical protein
VPDCEPLLQPDPVPSGPIQKAGRDGTLDVLSAAWTDMSAIAASKAHPWAQQ